MFAEEAVQVLLCTIASVSQYSICHSGTSQYRIRLLLGKNVFIRKEVPFIHDYKLH